MIRKILITTLFVGCITAVFAQKFYGGVVGGFNAAQVDGDGYSGYNQPGAVVGMWMQSDISDVMYWGMELKLSQKGAHKFYKKTNFLYNYRVNYIDLPITLGYQYSESVSAFVGASFDYLIGGSVSDNFDTYDIEYYGVQPWDVMMMLGVKVNFGQIVKQEWAERTSLDVRIQYSAFSVSDPKGFFLSTKPHGRYNNLLSTALYYRIGEKVTR